MKRGAVNLGLIVLMSICVILAGCGGGSSGNTSSGGSSTSTDNGGSNTGILTLSKYYAGTYTTNVITTSTPFLLTVAQNGNTLSGQFSSTKIAGSVNGTLNGNTLNLTITEPNGQGAVTMTATISGQTVSIGSITGVDTFGNNTSGTGSCTAQANAPAAVFADSYNGVAYLNNSASLSSTIPPFAPVSGPYPILISDLSPDGSGNYAGYFQSGFLSGILAVKMVAASEKLYLGIIYPGNGAINWAFGNGGFTDMSANLFLDRLDGSSYAYVYATVDGLKPGNPARVMPATWSYTAPSTSTSATGIQSLTITITSSDSVNFTAQINATLRQTSSGSLDTVSGALTGTYDLKARTDPNIPDNTFVVKFLPSGASSLTINNQSSLTNSFDLYVANVDTSAVPYTMQVAVDTGTANGTWNNITLTKQ